MLVRGRETTYYKDRQPPPAPHMLIVPSPTRSRTGGLRSTSVSAPTSTGSSTGQLFAGKAFVLSFVSDADAIAALITANAGSHFEDMSDFYRVEGATSNGGLRDGEYNSSHLKYVSDNRTILGLFLLADSATRRPKAFKALALGVPFVSTHYIRDALHDQAVGESNVRSFPQSCCANTRRDLRADISLTLCSAPRLAGLQAGDAAVVCLRHRP